MISNLLDEIYRASMIGHRIVEEFDIEEKLYDLFCNMLHTKEYLEFYLGRNGDFDTMAASVIKRLQKEFSDDNSVMILVLPYPVKDFEYYEEYYDEIVIPKELYGVHPKVAEQPLVCIWQNEDYKNIKQAQNAPAKMVFCFVEYSH